MTPPRFDALAPHYAWIEAASFGGLLQWCRTALVEDLADARRVLILGEGDGRFVRAFLAHNPAARVHVVDVSPTMVALARRRAGSGCGCGSGCGSGPGRERVTWQVADARAVEYPRAEYDLIVTNFFLDCFGPDDLARLIPRVAVALQPGGRWLVGDFRVPPGRLAGAASRVLLAAMYGFFRLTTRLPASRLVDPRPLLLARGLTPLRAESRLGGFLTSELWSSPPAPSTPIHREERSALHDEGPEHPWR
ncbi:class I SAM-dependent methyltransferase [Aquisphaera insulae]|uniref:class I SAM-dependent methyltransferase n=1 Tax=Aquisphaera insulae TaxID=2712864 RepID=UPI0013EA9837|nr:class I SAM-dependent methyltransferase [Aquisphaera insulae]